MDRGKKIRIIKSKYRPVVVVKDVVFQSKTVRIVQKTGNIVLGVESLNYSKISDSMRPYIVHLITLAIINNSPITTLISHTLNSLVRSASQLYDVRSHDNYVYDETGSKLKTL